MQQHPGLKCAVSIQTGNAQQQRSGAATAAAPTMLALQRSAGSSNSWLTTAVQSLYLSVSQQLRGLPELLGLAPPAAAIPTQCLSMASRSLTRLDWALSNSGDLRVTRAALPELRHLRILSVSCVVQTCGIEDYPMGSSPVEVMAAAVQPLTQLTALQLRGFRLTRNPLNAQFKEPKLNLQPLPDSLMELSVQPVPWHAPTWSESAQQLSGSR